MSEQYPNSGVLFKNDKKEGNPKFPDYNGNCEVDGKQFWISAWIKEGRKGKFMSLAFKPKEPLAQAVSKAFPTASAPASPAPEEDDIPF